MGFKISMLILAVIGGLFFAGCQKKGDAHLTDEYYKLAGKLEYELTTYKEISQEQAEKEVTKLYGRIEKLNFDKNNIQYIGIGTVTPKSRGYIYNNQKAYYDEVFKGKEGEFKKYEDRSVWRKEYINDLKSTIHNTIDADAYLNDKDKEIIKKGFINGTDSPEDINFYILLNVIASDRPSANNHNRNKYLHLYSVYKKFRNIELDELLTMVNDKL